MAENTHPTYLSPSELGSKDYWETYYARTRAHLSHDTAASEHQHETTDADSDAEVNDEDDPGTSWFSEHKAPEKVLRFLTRKSFPLSPRNTLRRQKDQGKDPDRPAQPSILDLGTGNGSMLALLRKKGGFAGRMVGVDYSAQSVELARELQGSRGHAAYRTDSEDEDGFDSDDDEEEQEGGRKDFDAVIQAGRNAPIQFEEWDILGSKASLSPSGDTITPSSDDETLPWFPYEQGGFDIVLDKGTFDAISLADNAETSRVCERYPDIARRLLRRGGFLVVTSCNWTEEELVKWFTSTGAGGLDRLVAWARVEYPRFRFGGQEGQGVCTVCFQRVGGISI